MGSFRVLILLSIVTAVLSVFVIYVERRGREALGLSDRAGRRVLAAMLAIVALPFVARALGVEGHPLLAPIVLFGFAAGLGALLTAGFLAPFDVVRGLWSRAHSWRKSQRAAPTAAGPAPSESGTESTSGSESASSGPGGGAPGVRTGPGPAPTPLARREFLSRAVIGGAYAMGAGTSGYGVLIGRHDYVLEDQVVRLNDLSPALHGYTIVQLSDVHIGSFVGEPELAAAIDLVRRARPDLIVLTGDLLDHDIRYAPMLGHFVERLGRLGARDGVISVPGNHDYYAGVEEAVAVQREAGARVLRNGAAVIDERLAILGVDDVWGAGADLDAALAHAPSELPRILLCHNPSLYPRVADRVDLQLSGHTHGGQINILFRPADLVLRHGYVAGHYRRGRSQIYVNRGFGTVTPPARIGSPPEVTRIVLT